MHILNAAATLDLKIAGSSLRFSFRQLVYDQSVLLAKECGQKFFCNATKNKKE